MQSNPPVTRARLSPRWIEALLIAFLVAIVCVIAWPGMSAPLLLDDIVQMDHIESFESWRDCLQRDHFGLFRPVKNFIFYQLQDVPLFGQHLFTLGAYLAATLAVYFLFRRLLGSASWGFAGALLWATCPTQASSAVWLSSANLSLAMVLSCGCILLHDLSRSKPGKNVGLAAMSCLILFLAQVTYEAALSVAGLCVLVDLLRKRSLFTKSSILRYAALGAVTLAFLAIRTQFGAIHSAHHANLGFEPDLEAWQLSVSAPWLVWKHLSMWLIPVGSIEFASTYLWGLSASMLELALAWVGLLLLLLATLVIWKRERLISIGILWFLASMFPISNLIPIWCGPIEDYYLVFPSVGIVLALLGCGQFLLRQTRFRASHPDSLRPVVAVCVLGAGALWRIAWIPMFWLQADLWNRPTELYLRMITTRPYQIQLHGMVAMRLAQDGQFEQALELANEAYPYGEWCANLSLVIGYVAFIDEDYPKAQSYLTKAIQRLPPSPEFHDYCRLYLAQTLHAQGVETSKARYVLIPLLERKDSTFHLEAINKLLDFYMENQQLDDALRAARKAVALHPDNPELAQRLEEIEAAVQQAILSP